MPVQFAELEVWVVVDEDGDYAVGNDDSAAGLAYVENIGELDGTRGIRRVKVTLRVPLPSPIELSASIPCEEGDASITVK